MNYAIVPNNGQSPDPDRGEIGPNDDTRPYTGFIPNMHIPDYQSGLADKSGFGNLGNFPIERFNHGQFLF
jgi:hypothetical protein